MTERWVGEFLGEPDPEFKTGLSKKQRDFIRRVYSENGEVQCHFPIWIGDTWRLCLSPNKIEVNHIWPQGYAKRVLGWTRNQIDNPLNLICLCSYHHVGKGYTGTIDWREQVVPVYHPDNIWASRHYKGKDKPTSYDIVFKGRRERCEAGLTYHNTDWTIHLMEIAEEKWLNYLVKNPEEKFPR